MKTRWSRSRLVPSLVQVPNEPHHCASWGGVDPPSSLDGLCGLGYSNQLKGLLFLHLVSWPKIVPTHLLHLSPVFVQEMTPGPPMCKY